MTKLDILEGKHSMTKNDTIKATAFASGTCVCGRSFMIFQLENIGTAMKFSKILKDTTDIYIANIRRTRCSNCGKSITLPASETLDPDRIGLTDLVNWLNKKADEKSDDRQD